MAETRSIKINKPHWKAPFESMVYVDNRATVPAKPGFYLAFKPARAIALVTTRFKTREAAQAYLDAEGQNDYLHVVEVA